MAHFVKYSIFVLFSSSCRLIQIYLSKTILLIKFYGLSKSIFYTIFYSGNQIESREQIIKVKKSVRIFNRLKSAFPLQQEILIHVLMFRDISETVTIVVSVKLSFTLSPFQNYFWTPVPSGQGPISLVL